MTAGQTVCGPIHALSGLTALVSIAGLMRRISGMTVTLAAAAVARRLLAERTVTTGRRWRIGTHFVLQLKGYLCTEGLTGTIGQRDSDWFTGGLRNGFGYISLAGKGGIAFDQSLRPPRFSSPRCPRCLRLGVPMMTYVEISASLRCKLAMSGTTRTLAMV